MLKYMLDTNIVIYTIRNQPSEVRDAFNRHAEQMCISSVTWGELVYGAEHSSRPEENLAVVEGMAARLEVLPFGTHVLRRDPTGSDRSVPVSCSVSPSRW